MKHDVLHEYQPPETQILLLIAALAEPRSAADAWRLWTSRRDVQTATWPEVRLLSAVAQRMAQLDPTSNLLPRLQGIRRFVWTQTQMCLSKTLPFLGVLSNDHIRFMLLKGAARIAVDPSSSADRLIRDVDILIDPDDWTAAVDAAVRENWRMDQDNPASARSKSFAEHHAINFTKSDAQVDLHRYALFMCRNSGDDDGLWNRGVPLLWRGKQVYIPGPTDEFLIALNHGFRHSHEPTADWALDAIALIRSGKIDWNLLLQESARREVDVSIAAGLTLLNQRIGAAIPQNVIPALCRRLHEPFISEFISNATAFEPQTGESAKSVLDAAAIRAQKAMSSARQNPPQESCMEKILKVDSVKLPRDRTQRLFASPKSLPTCGELRIDFDFTLWPFALGRRVILEIHVPGLLHKEINYAARRRSKFLPVRRRVSLRFPAALFAARNIDHITLRLVRPRLAIPMPVRTCVLRWRLLNPSARSRNFAV